ncbi:MAG: KamA family radical SAM protein, partial [Candidatus Dadabacteria bacterium]|nr:KamA family radical SAM protein [Candidatus Dadabacteria bacterium]
SNPTLDNWQQAIDYLKDDHSISEIILSGGDPLTLSDDKLSNLILKLSEIEHIKTVRIHSRIPIVLPDRINQQLLDWLTDSRLQIVFVVHVNHANELDNKVARAIQRLRNKNITIFNQSVLLKGINDSADTLSELSVHLFNIGVIPYYLHMLDPVAGTAHFKVDEVSARTIMLELHKTLPGYLVPRLVREIAGSQYKIPVELGTE